MLKGAVKEQTTDRIVQWLTRSPDTRKIPSSSLGMVIFLFQKQLIIKKLFILTLIYLFISKQTYKNRRIAVTETRTLID